jgi:hypothetical protein
MSMFRLILCAVASLWFVPFGMTPVHAAQRVADYDPRVFLEQAVAGADKIAHIRIVKREPLLYSGNERCGYAYTADVVESLKGGNEPFQFFLTRDEDFVGTDTDYLIFAYSSKKATPPDIKFFLGTFAEQEGQKVLCRARSDYYAPNFISTVWPFNPEATKRLGGQWIGPAQRPDVIWCAAGKYGFEAPTKTALFNFEETRVGGPLVVAWDSAKQLIARALNNSPYVPGVAPQFGAQMRSDFRPGAC